MQLRKTDLFTFIHKALRSLIYNAGSKLQSADFEDKAESDKIVYMLRNDLELLHEHAVHEDNIIFPEFKNEEAEMINALENEHKEIAAKLEIINELLGKISGEEDDETRLGLGALLNNLFNDFAASYLAHMNHEEATVLEASWKYLSDEELVGIRSKIQMNIPTDRYRIWLNWMLKSLNNSELTGLLSGMKAGAPQHVFENVVTTASAVIEPERWNSLKERIAV